MVVWMMFYVMMKNKYCKGKFRVVEQILSVPLGGGGGSLVALYYFSIWWSSAYFQNMKLIDKSLILLWGT